MKETVEEWNHSEEIKNGSNEGRERHRVQRRRLKQQFIFVSTIALHKHLFFYHSTHIFLKDEHSFGQSHSDSYLMLCFWRMSGSVALREATELPTGMFSILVTIRGSGKKTGPSLTSRTEMWTVVVELGP